MITANNLAFVKLTSWPWRRCGSLEQWGSRGDSLVTNIGLAAGIVGVLDHAALRGKVLVRWASTSQTNAWLSKFEQNLGFRVNFKSNCVRYWKKNWFLVISSKMKFMANLHIFYICLYKTMYASIIVMLWSAISGGGGEHFILYTNLSRVYFFQISYKYIEIYMVSMIYNINISYICIFM